MTLFWAGLGCIAQNTSNPPGRHTLPTPPRGSILCPFHRVSDLVMFALTLMNIPGFPLWPSRI